MAANVYRSVIDKWLLTVFVVTSATTLVVLIGALVLGLTSTSLVLIPVLLASVALPWWLLMTTDYTLTNHTLEIRSGPFRWSVPFRDITRIEATRSPVSSPALSLDRLRIQYSGGAQILISPEHRQNFLHELRQRGVNVAVER